jgi:beta-1,4-mannosyltransferase
MSVELIGFRGAPLPSSVSAARISSIPALEFLRARSGVAAIVVAAVRQFLLALMLTGRLISARKADILLMQAPPLLPVAPLAWLFARMRGARMVIDWHNSTAAMAAQRFGKGALSALVGRMERLFVGRRNITHLSVSSELSANLGLRAIVLRDSPPSRFQPASRRMTFDVAAGLQRNAAIMDAATESPALIVAPSSWSADDDFDLLLQALALADADLDMSERLLVALTGYGERRAGIEKAIDDLDLKRIAVVTGWLSEPDFIALLGSADAGLSVHRSASGLDIPIKIAEMINCGAHVLALDYGSVLAEVLQGAPATLFRTPVELATILARTARGGLSPSTPAFRLPSWTEEWARLVYPFIGPSIRPSITPSITGKAR